jgi:hypothetical protein
MITFAGNVGSNRRSFLCVGVLGVGGFTLSSSHRVRRRGRFFPQGEEMRLCGGLPCF